MDILEQPRHEDNKTLDAKKETKHKMREKSINVNLALLRMLKESPWLTFSCATAVLSTNI